MVQLALSDAVLIATERRRRAAGGAVVTLEHRNLERFGDDAEKVAAQLGGGWPQIMADYAGYADAHLETEMSS